MRFKSWEPTALSFGPTAVPPHGAVIICTSSFVPAAVRRPQMPSDALPLRPGGDIESRPPRRIPLRLHARAGFLHLFRVLEMQCFVLPHVLSTKPARWTVRPPGREHGLCSVGGAQTHAGELCASFAPTQSNGRKFSGNR